MDDLRFWFFNSLYIGYSQLRQFLDTSVEWSKTTIITHCLSKQESYKVYLSMSSRSPIILSSFLFENEHFFIQSLSLIKEKLVE